MKKLGQRLQTYLKFLSDSRQLMMSLLLIVVIPLALIFNTYFVVKEAGRNLDYELRLKAELTSTAVANFAADLLEDPSTLQTKITRVVDESFADSVKKIAVMVPEGENFKVIASTNDDEIGEIRPEWQYTFVAHESKTIAQLYVSRQDGKAERVWKVVTLMTDDSGAKKGLIDMAVSTAFMDSKTAAILQKSVIVLVFLILVVMLLIASNASLFRYTLLFNKLSEVDKMKDDFISVASHELKTPVTAAKGFLSLVMQEGAQLPKEIAYDISKANASLERLSALVNDLLDVSRIEQKRVQYDMRVVDVRPVLEEVVSSLREMSSGKQLSVEYYGYQGELPKVLIDEAKYRQIVMNLLSNAIKYTLQGKVEINIEYEGLGEIAISFKDTGLGMSAKEMTKLFSKFYRVSNRKARDVVGTGLGLWITRELTQAMGGKIFVESIEDVGSKFTVVFPIHKE